MNLANMRKKIHEFVEEADERHLLLISGMIENNQDTDWWDDLDPNIQASIEKALLESKNGLGKPTEEVMRNIREKYQ